MEYLPTLIAGAANTVSHSSVWIRTKNQSFLAFALHNVIAIVDVKANNIICSLRSHASKINAVCSCTSTSGDYVDLFSASDDGSIHVWRHNFLDSIKTWTKGKDLIGMKSTVTTVNAIAKNGGVIVAASDSLGFMNIWLGEQLEYHLVDTIRLSPAQMAYNICISELPTLGDRSACLALIVGCVDARIHIYTAFTNDVLSSTPKDTASGMFKSVGTLSGHEEWVTCLSAVCVDDKTLMLASGSQDSKIRIWKITAQQAITITNVNSLVEGVATLQVSGINDEDEDDDEDEEVQGGALIDEEESLSEARLQFSGEQGVSYAVFLDALLVGHEDWVTSLHWMSAPSEIFGANPPAPLRLFSTSMDRNMVIWASDELAGGIWMPSVRVGDIGGALGGSVGGNLLGFVGGCMSSDGSSIVGVGYGGSFHLWSKNKKSTVNNSSVEDVEQSAQDEDERWFPVPFIGGHFGSVNDLAWWSEAGNAANTGSYLVTASSDQTCRLFAPLKTLNTVADNITNTPPLSTTAESNVVWKEVSRPQIHGYDLNCIALEPSSHVIYTGGEEKLIRVFDAPEVVLNGLKVLCGVESTVDKNKESGIGNRVPAAYIPELGLSNKAADTMSGEEKREQEARRVSTVDWRFHPLEGQLADHTLWPEIQKLFGHNNDVMCMHLSGDGKWLASANKARDTKTAQILLWAAQGRDLVGRLAGHESTVVTVRFSPDNKYLASSGKDRSLCLYQHTTTSTSTGGEEEEEGFQHVVLKKSAHKRIVWGVSWTPDSSKLLTVSRDGFCKVWVVRSSSDLDTDLECIHTFSPFNGTAVTALDIRESVVDGSSESSWLVAFGAENGDIQVSSLSLDGKSSTLLHSVDSLYCHGATVRCIKWRPTAGSGERVQGEEQQQVEFATCGEDNTVRIHKLKLKSEQLL